MDRREVEQEIEDLDIESRKVAELLGSLKRAEAPSNFDFGLRARMANGAPTRRSMWIPVLKLAAPLSLVLIVATIVVIYNIRPVEDVPIFTAETPVSAPVDLGPASNAEPVPDPKVSAPMLPGPGTALPASSRPTVAANPVKRDVPARRGVDRPTGGSLPNQMVKESVIINPPGISPNTTRNANGPEIPVREVLQMLGVSADPQDGGWKVKSTVEGSASRRSGIQTGDVIESIDGLGITDKTSFKSPVTVKSVRILRSGKSLDVKLTN